MKTTNGKSRAKANSKINRADVYEGAVSYILSELPEDMRKAVIRFADEYFKLFEIVFNELNPVYTDKTKTPLDKALLKTVVMDDLFNRYLYKIKSEYDRSKETRSISFVKTAEEMWQIMKDDKENNPIIFCEELNRNIIKKAMGPYLAGKRESVPIIQKSLQGGGPKEMLPLYYAIIDCIRGNGSTKDFRDTLRRVLKGSAKYFDIFGSDFDAAINIQRNKFKNFIANIGQKNIYNLNSNEDFISFLCGSLKKEVSYIGGTFRGAFKKYYDKRRKKQNKEQILKSILTTFHKSTSQN